MLYKKRIGPSHFDGTGATQTLNQTQRLPVGVSHLPKSPYSDYQRDLLQCGRAVIFHERLLCIVFVSEAIGSSCLHHNTDQYHAMRKDEIGIQFIDYY